VLNAIDKINLKIDNLN
jgi:hypothetical protein